MSDVMCRDEEWGKLDRYFESQANGRTIGVKIRGKIGRCPQRIAVRQAGFDRLRQSEDTTIPPDSLNTRDA